MDNTTIRSLLQFVVRGFYGNPYVLIMDAVLLHSVLSEEDMSYLVGIQKKELRSICQKLIDDRLLTVHTQKEPGPQMRPVTKTYYFIHFTEAIDSIKWKVHSVVKSVQKDINVETNPQGFVCPVCKSKYSQLDSLSLLNYEKNAFNCSLCGEELIEDDSGKIAKETQDKYEKLMKQINPIINYLKKIDEVSVPENNFELSLGKVIPAQANTTASYSVSAIGKNSKMFNKDSYLNNLSSRKAGAKSQATLHVNITANDDNLVRERQRLEQEAKKKQNAMPAWHEQSTVGAAQLGVLNDDDEAMEGDVNPDENGVKKEDEVNAEIKTEAQSAIPAVKTNSAPSQTTAVDTEDKEAQDALAAYYEQLAQREKEEADDEDEEEEEEEEEDDDDEDDEEIEFDDVDLEDVNIASQPTPSQEVKAEDLVVEEDFGDSDEE